MRRRKLWPRTESHTSRRDGCPAFSPVGITQDAADLIAARHLIDDNGTCCPPDKLLGQAEGFAGREASLVPADPQHEIVVHNHRLGRHHLSSRMTDLGWGRTLVIQSDFLLN